MSRELYVKFTIDWEDYEDVPDELVFEDMELVLKDGIKVEILNSIEVRNEHEGIRKEDKSERKDQEDSGKEFR